MKSECSFQVVLKPELLLSNNRIREHVEVYVMTTALHAFQI